MKIYFAFALLLLCYAVGADDPVCGKDEVFTGCEAACQHTCENPDPQICPAICLPGCLCKDGYLRNAEEQCIPSDQCPTKCGENEVHTDCLADCQHTCENPHPHICTAVCREGCLCKEGYLRDAEGQCIPSENCPSSCGPNEEFSGCVIPCNDCVVKGDCQFLVCNPGCDCIKGYYRNRKGRCIPECKCPRCSRKNEKYSSCVSPCNTCEEKGECEYECKYGCDCIQGYYRNRKGTCIPESQCPCKCGKNEEHTECGAGCQPTCEVPHPDKCTLECIIGCICKEGYLKNADGECVEPGECPSNLPTCQQPPKTGNCYGAFWRFYYNPKKGKCEEFLYGGCNGNRNNFETKEECEATCCREDLPTCEQPPEQGTCDGYFPRFYYNCKIGKCEEFIYGGCEGNENNFETIEECEKTCCKKGGHHGSGSAAAAASSSSAAGGGGGGKGGSSGSSAAAAAASGAGTQRDWLTMARK